MSNPPAKSYPAVPRKVDCPLHVTVSNLIALCLFTATMFVVFLRYSQAKDTYKARAYGASTKARVVSINDRIEPPVVRVALRMRVGEVTTWSEVPPEFAKEFKSGDTILASYDPKDPTSPFLGSDKRFWPSRPSLPIAFSLLQIAVAILQFAITIPFLLQRRWLRDAQAFPGRIVSRKVIGVAKEGDRVEFEWYEGESRKVDHAWIHPMRLPDLQPGSPITVLVNAKGKSRIAETLWAVRLSPEPEPSPYFAASDGK